MNQHKEKYLTIKELLGELKDNGLPSSYSFVKKCRNKNPKIWKCNRVKLSEFLSSL